MGPKGEGLKVDSDGRLVADSLKLNDGMTSKPHNIAGIPTTPNPIAEMSPRMVFNPQIDVMPDFSILNWAVNICNVTDRVLEIIRDYSKLEADFLAKEAAARKTKGTVL